MRKELEQKLFNDFPSFFRWREKGPKYTLMVFGFDFGDGWFDLVYQLCGDIQKLLEKDPELKKEFIVLQVKEKFAGLRFYVGSATDEIFDRINKAEEESYKICEICGEPGIPRWDLFWKQTLCDKHYNKKLEELHEKGQILRISKKEGSKESGQVPAEQTFQAKVKKTKN